MPAAVPVRTYETLEEAAKRLSCHPRTLRRRIAEGQLVGYRLAGSPLIRVDAVEVDGLLRPMPTAGRVA